MDAVLAFLWLGHRQEEDVEPRPVRRRDTDLVVRFVVDLPIQNAGPEPGKTNRVVCIEAKVGELRCYLRLPPLPNRGEARLPSTPAISAAANLEAKAKRHRALLRDLTKAASSAC
jgi:hypothetical protein